MTIRIVIDGEPIAKGRARVAFGSGRVHAFTPAATRKHEAHARLCAQLAMDGKPPLHGAVKAEVTAVLPVPTSFSKRKAALALQGELRPVKRPDLDNFVKAALDACNQIVFADDAQIVDLTARKQYGAKPQLIIEVTPQ